MKLLILTQKVDRNDPILGFFHRWIIEFSKNCESIIVVCLRKGQYELPKNVRVLSLGKEEGVSRLKYLYRFYSHIWTERKNYDKVFVHMNPIYVVLGGPVWKIIGKKISVWYMHKSVDWKLRITEKVADRIFTGSKESFRLASKKVRVMGHGIDVDFFSPDPKVTRSTTLLSVGRLMPTKRHDVAIQAAAQAGRPLRIAGDGPAEENLRKLAQSLKVSVEFLGPLTQEQLPDEYRRASFLVHTSETGSLDKVVLEALACGLRVISTSSSLSGLPIIKVSPTPEAIAEAISKDYATDVGSLVSYVCDNHSLQHVIPAITENIKSI